MDFFHFSAFLRQGHGLPHPAVLEWGVSPNLGPAGMALEVRSHFCEKASWFFPGAWSMIANERGVFSMEFAELYQKAVEVLNPRQVSENVETGGVAAALVTDKGNVYRGVCIDTACSLGFCAEHAAIAAMFTAGENRVEKIVAVGWDKRVMAPCGRCREFLMQLGNPDALVLVAEDTVVKVKDLLPYYWTGDNQ